jgi:pimeloyl-ACP methyl ester carboxylesterase
MKNLRTYGRSPFGIAVIHGGPGAPGEMAPVARELAADWGVLEPLQTAASLEGQIEELQTILTSHGDMPLTLIGFSWGAWLSYIVAATYPTLVKKLVLVGSGSYEEQYTTTMQETRLRRLSAMERTEVQSLKERLEHPQTTDKRVAFKRLGALLNKADAYDPMPYASEIIAYQDDVFQCVWQKAAKWRRTGKLLELGKQIICPVVAIHGAYDSHPAEGVQKPLSAMVDNFRFILLQHCGHMPWIERQAREEFYSILKAELRKEV